MSLSETFDVPFVPSQIAQPEGGTMATLPSAPRLNAEGGGNQAITVLAGVSGVFAPDVAMIMKPRGFPLQSYCGSRAHGYRMAVSCAQLSTPHRATGDHWQSL